MKTRYEVYDPWIDEPLKWTQMFENSTKDQLNSWG